MPSRIVPTEYAAEMIERFLASCPDGHERSYIFSANHVLDFKNTIESNVEDNGKLKGIAIRFGRPAPDDSLNMGFEAVMYKRNAASNSVEAYGLLDDNAFNGRLSPDFGTNMHLPDERASFNRAISNTDDSKVTLALIDFDTFKEFVGNSKEFKSLKLEFARNSDDQLTVLISRRDKAGNPIMSSVSGIKNLYLDDHDLIPPP